MTVTRMLVCEGACNPTIAALDAEVRRTKAVRDEPVNGVRVMAASSPDLTRRLRALRHTVHRFHPYVDGGEGWVCSVCRTMRRG